MKPTASRQVPRQVRAGQPDDGKHPAGCQQQVHPRQRRGRVHVMQRRHRSDHAEGGRAEGMGEKVSPDEGDLAARVLPAGQLEARSVLVDRGHLRHHPGKLPGQHALAAADVQRPMAAVRHGRHDPRVVVDVVVPALADLRPDDLRHVRAAQDAPVRLTRAGCVHTGHPTAGPGRPGRAPRHLRAHGPAPEAFTLRVHFPPPGAAERAARPGRADWLCPAQGMR
jgi:hypothetical protein